VALVIPDESLCSVADATAYHESRGSIATWSPLDTPSKEQLLRRAFDYLQGTYGASWKAGVAFGFDDAGVIPPRVRDACAILALRAKDGPLDPEITPQKIESEVGPIKSKFAARENGGRRIFPDIARMVGPYLEPIRAYSIPLVRS
jgi:hypothetical protein